MAWIYNSTLNYPAGAVIRPYTYDVFQQPLATDCVPSSMIMILKRVLNRNLALGMAHARIAREKFFRTGQAGLLNAWHWHPGGAGQLDAFNALVRHYPAHPWFLSAQNPAALPTFMQQHQLAACTPNNPAMVFIRWHAGGGHAALCIGRPPAPGGGFQPEILFLDPYYGVVAFPFVPAFNINGLQYDTTHNSFGVGVGQGTIVHAIFS